MNKYHYTECGLQNVYISGIEVVVDDMGDEIITIPAVAELHHVIALGIVMHEYSISGDELKFLRTEMGYSRTQLAKLVHRDQQTVGRWERDENEIDEVSEIVIRRLAIEKLNLETQQGIDELSKSSVVSENIQPIQISMNAANENQYELVNLVA